MRASCERNQQNVKNAKYDFADVVLFSNTCDIMSAAVQKLLASAKVAIFSKTSCPYCVKVSAAE